VACRPAAGGTRDTHRSDDGMPVNDDPSGELRRLRWRCRRGMKELDVLLLRWLEREWGQASEADRGIFLRLLDCEDDKLWRWFMGYEVPPDAELEAFVGRISALPPQD
jgi:antitoxin CptB